MSKNSMVDLVYSVSKIAEISDLDIAAWEELRKSNKVYSSALLTPNFAKSVASFRDDVRVVLIKSTGKLVGVFCVHERPGGLARPIGVPFDDYSGPIIAEGYQVNLHDFLKAGHWASYRAATCITPVTSIPDAQLGAPEHSFVIQLDGVSAEDYLAARYQENSKRHKNFRRLSRKLEKDYANISFKFGTPSKENLEQLFKWKSAQFKRSGLVNIIETSFSQGILKTLGNTIYTEENGYGGFATELWADGKLIAGHFGVRSGGDFHPWISAYDPEFSEAAPGIVLLYRAIENMNKMGLNSYDLSGGHDHYKKYFAQPVRTISSLSVSRESLMGRIQAAGFNSWNLLGTNTETSVASRMRRRFDHIAVCEPNLLKRMQEVSFAFAKRGKSVQ